MVKDRHIDKNARSAERTLIFPVADADLGIDLATVLQGDCLIKAPTLAVGTVSAAEIAVGEIVWQIDGMRYLLAAAEHAFTATTHDIADPDADPREAIYVLSVAAGASAVTITKGTTAAADAAVAPSTPAGHVKLGELLLQHDGSAIFNATTDDLDAAHLTATFTPETAYGETALTDAPVAEFTPGFDFVVTDVRHRFHDVGATFTYDVEIDGVTCLAGAVTPADATQAAATLATAFTARVGGPSAVLSVDVTKDADGIGRGGYVAVSIRPYHMKGDAHPVL